MFYYKMPILNKNQNQFDVHNLSMTVFQGEFSGFKPPGSHSKEVVKGAPAPGAIFERAQKLRN